jgi:hypothetical protein
MSEERDDQGRWVLAFVLGVIVGALLILGLGGGLWMVQARQMEARALEARERAVRAEEEARIQRDLAVQHMHLAEKQAEQAVRDFEKAAKEGEPRKGGK